MSNLLSVHLLLLMAALNLSLSFDAGLLCILLTVLNSPCRSGWPQTHRGTLASVFLNAGITGVHHHAWLALNFLGSKTNVDLSDMIVIL